MALTGTIFAGVYNGILGPGAFLRIQAGGTSLIPTHHDLYSLFSPTYTKQGFVWNGQPYFYVGTEKGTGYGLWTYDENLDKMVRVGLDRPGHISFPFGEKVLMQGEQPDHRVRPDYKGPQELMGLTENKDLKERQVKTVLMALMA